MTHTLTINLASIAHNWRTLNTQLASGVDCGAVVKADAYGLGMDKVIPALYFSGCRSFYVANLDEALQTQSVLQSTSNNALGSSAVGNSKIIVLSGCAPGEEQDFIENSIIPVIVSEPMLQRWLQATRQKKAVAALKINTGMGRLGLELEEFLRLFEEPGLLTCAGIEVLMSHLACADEPGHPLNGQQLQRFSQALSQIQKIDPAVRGCLANSSGICLGPEYHFDAVRPGIGLYGGFSQMEDLGVALQEVVSLHLPVVQTRNLPAGESVGYGATRHFSQTAKLAIVAGGYADGLFRSLSNRGASWVADPNGEGGWLAPIVGRISMDTTIVDISAVPEGVVHEGARLEFIGPHLSVENIAKAAGTVSYEVLTSLGARYNRHYLAGEIS
ncbi:alanine racemase [Alteromonadaceae bacterium 2753L.S.0a.02]|nr:alanine racemase [Alteromonadaceae bacterium 2753L.S.0a.02]